MEACHCQSYGKPTLVPGHLVVGEGSQIFRFAPAATHSHVKVRVAFHACTSCGHVWARVAPDELRNTIDRFGKELIKQQFDLNRARKLAFFGWNPKGKLDVDDSALREQPMRGRLLDG